jgi:hypothetical protein
MIWQSQRAEFEAPGCRRLLGQLASAFRAEDARKRASRRSWDDLQKIEQRNPEIFASVVVDTNVAGGRR